MTTDLGDALKQFGDHARTCTHCTHALTVIDIFETKSDVMWKILFWDIRKPKETFFVFEVESDSELGARVMMTLKRFRPPILAAGLFGSDPTRRAFAKKLILPTIADWYRMENSK